MRSSVLLALALVLPSLASCAGDMSGPMTVRSRTPEAPPTQDEVNRQMIDEAIKRERLGTRGM